ncbi:MAG TPA: glycine--tRNA ligase subunit beta [Candidatus Eisenbacteria bacterium]|nr:glycine--tRNA ligase subunit beta [Candidatus Eisenbacteria bacterium]
MADVSKRLLLEIGCEELPASFIAPALAELEGLARSGLAEARLAFASARVLGTPRRLALIVEGLSGRQEDRVREVLGPALKVAYDAAGNPTNAAKGFAKGAGIAVEALEKASTPKGDYLMARVHDHGKPVDEVLPELLRAWIAGLHFPKTMHWNATGRFARPVRWVVALLGADPIPFEVFGIASGNRSRGHRTIAPDWFVVPSPAEYVAALRERGVLVDPAERRARIEEELARAAAPLGGKAVPDPDLLDEVTHLVEWPEAVVGSFDSKYLQLPRPVVVTAMRAHQRYFAVERPDGSLLGNFIMIRSGRGEGADQVRRGTQAVLRARLEDARFYWENDLKGGLEAKVEALRGMVWHERLGSIHDRTRRLEFLADDLARTLAPQARAAVARAARLCKADLATEMVRSGKEFATLQGIVGAEYAAATGEPEAVVRAIREHYLPQGPSDPLPESVEGTILSLADRIEAIAGGFRAGLEVTGSQDPYGLRRAGNGVVRTLIEKRLRLDVLAVAGRVAEYFDKEGVAADPKSAELPAFWAQRVENALEELGITHDSAAAVLAVRPGDPLDVLARARAIEAIRQGDDFEGLMIGYRRAANLLRTAKPEDISASGTPMAERAEHFGEKVEADLHLETKMARQSVETLLQASDPDYERALRVLLGLRGVIDGFFDGVMVMVDDTVIRRRRLSLLEAVRQTFLRIADFSVLPAGAGQKVA